MTEPETRKRLDAGEDPLDLAIEKWVDIREGRGDDRGRDNCALCIAYIHCSACPVYFQADEPGCEETPYIVWMAHHKTMHNIDMPGTCICPECEQIADAEIAFLRALKVKIEKE